MIGLVLWAHMEISNPPRMAEIGPAVYIEQAGPVSHPYWIRSVKHKGEPGCLEASADKIIWYPVACEREAKP